MSSAPPRVERRRLLVDDTPYLVLGGELHNSSASHPALLRERLDAVRALGANTLLAPISWELVEPSEGRFDLGLVDCLVSEARARRLRLVPLWFGAWKNGRSHYAPTWVLRDPTRFTVARDGSGRALPTLSTFCPETLAAEERAFEAVTARLAEADPGFDTALMLQVENEVGLLGASRDHSRPAEEAFERPMPGLLADALRSASAELRPAVRRALDSEIPEGTWSQAVGDGPDGDEIFQAWSYARHVDHLVVAGKANLPVPMFVNAWLESWAGGASATHGGEGPGDYPSGGPQPHVAPVWRWAAPHVDLLCPDIYEGDFRARCHSYREASPNGLFVPETAPGTAAGNACIALGEGALGVGPFGADGVDPSSPEAAEMRVAFASMAQIAPLLADDSTPRLGFRLDAARTTMRAESDDLQIEVRPDRHGSDEPFEGEAWGLIIRTANEQWVGVGRGFAVRFFRDGVQLQLEDTERGRFANGDWETRQRLNGDETDGGEAWRFPHDDPAFAPVNDADGRTVVVQRTTVSTRPAREERQ